MKNIDIVEGLNRYFECHYPNKGHFVSKLNIETNKLVKALKTYTLELWYINGKNKELFLTTQLDKKPSEEEDKILRELNIKFTESILNNFYRVGRYGV